MSEGDKDAWAPGKYLGAAARKTWEGTKAVGRAVRDNPGHAVVGAVVGGIVAGPVGMVVGAGGTAWIGEKNGGEK
jgi:hypothetical protein